MSIRQAISAFAIVAAQAVPNDSRADSSGDRPPCFLGNDRVHSVQPYYGKASLGEAEFRRLHGAELQLVPRRGLTAEHLERKLHALLRARDTEPLPACLTDVGHVHIESDPLGDATSVQLIARDPSDAEQVFRRARQLLDG